MSTESANKLQLESAGVRVSFNWFGTKKTLNNDEKAQAAKPFGAEAKALTASKRLIDLNNKTVKLLTGLKGEITQYWKGITLPYVEDGVRLIRQADVTDFVEVMNGYKAKLDETVSALDKELPALKQDAKSRLGKLYNDADYPSTVIGEFNVTWDFPSLAPPEWMKAIDPGLYEQERKRIAAKFEEAVGLAEQAFAVELADMVSHLAEKLSSDGGEKKKFKDSSVNNLKQFFERFQHVSIGSNEKLDELVQEAKKLVGDADADEFRTNEDLRQHAKEGLAKIASVLDEQIILQPRRTLTKHKKAEPVVVPAIAEKPSINGTPELAAALAAAPNGAVIEIPAVPSEPMY